MSFVLEDGPKIDKLYALFGKFEEVRKFWMEEYFSTPLEETGAGSSVVINERMKVALYDSFTRKLCGVVVLAAPPPTSKTNAVCTVANRLVKDNKLKGAAYFKCTESAQGVSTWEWMYSQLSLHANKKESNFPLSKFIPESDSPVALIFDIFDNQMTATNVESFVKSMAEDSVHNKKFIVILIVSYPLNMDRLLTINGYEKIILCDNPLKFKRTGDFTDESQHWEEFRRSPVLNRLYGSQYRSWWL
jgi:hypothetical protein